MKIILRLEFEEKSVDQVENDSSKKNAEEDREQSLVSIGCTGTAATEQQQTVYSSKKIRLQLHKVWIYYERGRE